MSQDAFNGGIEILAMPAAHTGYVIWNVRGINAEGERFLMSDGVAVGYGARPTADGHDAIYLVA